MVAAVSSPSLSPCLTKPPVSIFIFVSMGESLEWPPRVKDQARSVASRTSDRAFVGSTLRAATCRHRHRRRGLGDYIHKQLFVHGSECSNGPYVLHDYIGACSVYSHYNYGVYCTGACSVYLHCILH